MMHVWKVHGNTSLRYNRQPHEVFAQELSFRRRLAARAGQRRTRLLAARQRALDLLVLLCEPCPSLLRHRVLVAIRGIVAG